MKKRKRRYVLKARGEQLAATRLRIVESIMGLHQDVGPRNTTVSGIAERAGVERLTVYRHFADEAAMFNACSQHYLTLNPPPDPASLAGEPNPVLHARRGLEDLYAYFTRTAPMFAKIYPDVGEFESLKKIMDGFGGYLGSVAGNLAAAWPRDGAGARRETILRHAVKFATWQSLEADGVRDPEKVALILEWLVLERATAPTRKK